MKAHPIKRIKTRHCGDTAILLYMVYNSDSGHAVAQVVEAQRYKPEGRAFD